jgi:hypothetical protein
VTSKQFRALTPEQQRITVAELAGWKYMMPWSEIDRSRWFGLSPDGHRGVEVPDYLHNLNAMHEAESRCTQEQRDALYGNIWKLVRALPSTNACQNIENGWLVYHATAAQRAEAFVITMTEGKE